MKPKGVYHKPYGKFREQNEAQHTPPLELIATLDRLVGHYQQYPGIATVLQGYLENMQERHPWCTLPQKNEP